MGPGVLGLSFELGQCSQGTAQDADSGFQFTLYRSLKDRGLCGCVYSFSLASKSAKDDSDEFPFLVDFGGAGRSWAWLRIVRPPGMCSESAVRTSLSAWIPRSTKESHGSRQNGHCRL